MRFRDISLHHFRPPPQQASAHLQPLFLSLLSFFTFFFRFFSLASFLALIQAFSNFQKLFCNLSQPPSSLCNSPTLPEGGPAPVFAGAPECIVSPLHCCENIYNRFRAATTPHASVINVNGFKGVLVIHTSTRDSLLRDSSFRAGGQLGQHLIPKDKKYIHTKQTTRAFAKRKRETKRRWAKQEEK